MPIFNVIILDPFLGPSHKNTWYAYKRNSQHKVEIFPFSDKNWKLASGLSGFCSSSNLEQSLNFENQDLFIVSEYFDIAAFKSLNPKLINKAFICYFHENQFEYPVKEGAKRDNHFALTNLKNFICSDFNIFNSDWNRKSFFEGVKKFRKALPHFYRKFIDSNIETLGNTEIIHPSHCMDISVANFNKLLTQKTSEKKRLKVLWNHRWEYDKNPELLINIIERAHHELPNICFDICGWESPRSELREHLNFFLGKNVDHLGFYSSKNAYQSALISSDIVLSTAIHEFYGISVLEGICFGLDPILPNRLSYPELYKSKFPNQFYNDLESAISLLGAAVKNRTSNFDPLNMDRANFFFEAHHPEKSAKRLDQLAAEIMEKKKAGGR